MSTLRVDGAVQFNIDLRNELIKLIVALAHLVSMLKIELLHFLLELRNFTLLNISERLLDLVDVRERFDDSSVRGLVVHNLRLLLLINSISRWDTILNLPRITILVHQLHLGHVVRLDRAHLGRVVTRATSRTRHHAAGGVFLAQLLLTDLHTCHTIQLIVELARLSRGLQSSVRLESDQVLMQRESALGLDGLLWHILHSDRLYAPNFARGHVHATDGTIRSQTTQALLIAQLLHLLVRRLVEESCRTRA